MRNPGILLLFTVAVLGALPFHGCTTADDDLTLSYQQKQSLDKFKESVVTKLPFDYMKQDAYLIRWLRARDFDPEQAEQFLMQHLKWREQNKMDDILSEPWSDMSEDFPYRLDSHDKEGKPVFFGEFGRWNLRDADVTGRFQRLIRYGEKIMEEEETLIRQLQAEGKSVTRTMLVLDMDGFNAAQHLCSRCFTFILEFYQTFEENYPGLIDTLYFINNHPLVNTILHTMLSSFAPQTRKIVRLYGRNKDEFSKALLTKIDPSQLPKRYGGMKED